MSFIVVLQKFVGGFIAGCLTVAILLNSSYAQDGIFDDLFLDGGASGAPFIRFDQPDQLNHLIVGWNYAMGFYVDDGYKFLIDEESIDNSLVLDGQGVNTVNLNVNGSIDVRVPVDRSPSGIAQITVVNDVATTGLREMFALINNGGSRFTMENTANKTKWAFASDALGRFTFSLDGSGGPEIAVTTSGRILMGPGPETNFDLRPNGNLILAGTLTQSSDRDLKTEFQQIEPETILEKIVTMPITTWRFKSDQPKIRHIGPTAQDFYKAFELGLSERTLAPVDGIGVSLAAIKALDHKVEQLEARQATIDRLQQKLTQQNRQLETQQQLIESLAQRLATLEASALRN